MWCERASARASTIYLYHTVFKWKVETPSSKKFARHIEKGSRAFIKENIETNFTLYFEGDRCMCQSAGRYLIIRVHAVNNKFGDSFRECTQ